MKLEYRPRPYIVDQLLLFLGYLNLCYERKIDALMATQGPLTSFWSRQDFETSSLPPIEFSQEYCGAAHVLRETTHRLPPTEIPASSITTLAFLLLPIAMDAPTASALRTRNFLVLDHVLDLFRMDLAFLVSFL